MKANDKYKRILEAAIKVFARHGFRQSTISMIAREAGVADGTIYLYFKNKDDILVNFFTARALQAFERFREEVDRAEGAVSKLRSLIRKHLEEFQSDPDMAVVYQCEMHQHSRVVEKQIKEMSDMYMDLIASIVEQGQQEGSIKKSLYLGLVKRVILGSVDEVISTWLHSTRKYDLVSMSEPLVDLLLGGIGTGSDIQNNKKEETQ